MAPTSPRPGSAPPPRRVVVAGWIGSTNLGDELILAGLLDHLRELGAVATAISRDPGATRASHAIDAVRDRDLRAVRRAIRDADLMVFGGGGLVQDATSPFNLPYHLGRIAMARSVGTSVLPLGLEVSALRTRLGRAQARRALRPQGAGVLAGAVRDPGSAAAMVALGAPAPTIAADLALRLPSPTTPPIDRIVACLRPWTGGGLLPVSMGWRRGLEQDWFLTAAARALDAAAEATGLDVHLVAMQRGRDDVLHDLVADRMRASVTTAAPDLATVRAEIAASRVVIGMRYHAVIAAILGTRPVVAIGYSDKVVAIAAEVGPCVAWSPAGLAELPAHVVEVLAKPPEVAAVLARLRDLEAHNHAVLAAALAPA